MIKTGDIVTGIPGKIILRSGSEVYTYAYVVSSNPFVLISLDGQMVWRHTIKPHHVQRVRTTNSVEQRMYCNKYIEHFVELRPKKIAVKRKKSQILRETDIDVGNSLSAIELYKEFIKQHAANLEIPLIIKCGGKNFRVAAWAKKDDKFIIMAKR
jgi:hypothetical protein